MCSYSAVMDGWQDTWRPYTIPPIIQPQVDQEQLRRDIAEFRKLLEKARAWDKAHPQEEPCRETEEKVEQLRKLAEELGVADEVEIVIKETAEEPDPGMVYVQDVTKFIRSDTTSG
jgi:nucleotide-binding universal stress UspA family protein